MQKRGVRSSTHTHKHVSGNHSQNGQTQVEGTNRAATRALPNTISGCSVHRLTKLECTFSRVSRRALPRSLCPHTRLSFAHVYVSVWSLSVWPCARVCVCVCVARPQWRFSAGLRALLFPPDPDPISAEQRYSAEERERVNGASLTPAGGGVKSGWPQ